MDTTKDICKTVFENLEQCVDRSVALLFQFDQTNAFLRFGPVNKIDGALLVSAGTGNRPRRPDIG